MSYAIINGKAMINNEFFTFLCLSSMNFSYKINKIMFGRALFGYCILFVFFRVIRWYLVSLCLPNWPVARSTKPSRFAKNLRNFPSQPNRKSLFYSTRQNFKIPGYSLSPWNFKDVKNMNRFLNRAFLVLFRFIKKKKTNFLLKYQ